ncbi:MAG: DUF3791 domain-containing protein [Paludibacteraceae bacterium]|nr:DUF3791 domain-containing protein [Paludibacteraceae bacterium]
MSQFEIPFIALCIREFGKHFQISRQTAYNYLHKYNGLSFLSEFYDVEHLQSIEETIDDLILCCNNHGGSLK